MNCPKCTVPLKVSDRDGVQIDICPDCRGVWLDRGELDKIIERSSSGRGFYRDDDDHHDDHRHNDHDRDKHYHDDDHREHRGKPYRKKGFLSDLFDF